MPPQLSHLVHVLDTQNTGLGRDDVAWGFDSAESRKRLSDWVDEYLSPHTLLTAEEAAFHEKHGTSYKDEPLTGPPLLDEDIESAISSLEASTAAIERQCRLLEAQKQALRDIQARNGRNVESDSLGSQRTVKLAREKAQVEFGTTELAESMHPRLERAMKQTESSMNGVQPMAERILEKDDRLLDGLEKLLPRLAPAATDIVDANEVAKLCEALTVLSSQEIHARVDAVYTTTVQNYGTKVNGHHRKPSTQSLETQRDTLRAELEELCREIDGLSMMAVEQQYRAPMSRALRAAGLDEETQKTAWAEYLSSVLRYLINRVDATVDMSYELRARNSALRSISAALQSVQTSGGDPQTGKSHAQSPVKASQKGLKPLRLVQANLSESHDPVAQLMRQLDIKAAELNDSEQLAATLAVTTRTKMGKLLSQVQATETSVSGQIATSIVNAGGNLEPLLSSVFAHSDYKTVKLASGPSTLGIAALEDKTQLLSEQMRGLDVAGIERAISQAQADLLRSS